MGDLTKNISRHEIACQCGCGEDTIDFETVTVVQETCDHFAEKLGVDKVVLLITSGSRCDAHNKAEGGAKESQHPKNRAIDFKIIGVKPADVYDYLDKKYPNKYGIGRYNSFTHVDTRSTGKARW